MNTHRRTSSDIRREPIRVLREYKAARGLMPVIHKGVFRNHNYSNLLYRRIREITKRVR